MRRLAVVSVVVLVAACGGDSSVEREEYVQAVLTGIEDTEDFVFEDEDDQECLAEAVVDSVGVEELNDADVEPEDLEEAESLADVEGLEIDDDVRDDLSDAFQACELDLSGAAGPLTEALGTLNLSDASLECFSEELSQSQELADVLVTAVVEGEDEGAEEGGREAAFVALRACPEALTDLFIAGVEQGIGPVSAEVRACLEERILGDIDAVADALVENDPDAFGELGRTIVAPCAR